MRRRDWTRRGYLDGSSGSDRHLAATCPHIPSSSQATGRRPSCRSARCAGGRGEGSDCLAVHAGNVVKTMECRTRRELECTHYAPPVKPDRVKSWHEPVPSFIPTRKWIRTGRGRHPLARSGPGRCLPAAVGRRHVERRISFGKRAAVGGSRYNVAAHNVIVARQSTVLQFLRIPLCIR